MRHRSQSVAEEAIAHVYAPFVRVQSGLVVVVARLNPGVGPKAVRCVHQTEIDRSSDHVRVPVGRERLDHFNAGQHVGGDHAQVRAPVVEVGAGDALPVHEHVVELRREAANHDLLPLSRIANDGYAGQAADRLGGVDVWKLLNAGGRNDVQDRIRRKLLVDRRDLPLGLSRDHDFAPLHHVERQLHVDDDDLPGTYGYGNPGTPIAHERGHEHLIACRRVDDAKRAVGIRRRADGRAVHADGGARQRGARLRVGDLSGDDSRDHDVGGREPVVCSLSRTRKEDAASDGRGRGRRQEDEGRKNRQERAAPDVGVRRRLRTARRPNGLHIERAPFGAALGSLR